ncbi:hypothetical protein VC885_13360, partial [Citrobacter freundii]|nr:hypothetical protein [Citrobacter freundii]MEB0855201.1 hypothetical protein [Citrobacter freundii]
SVRHIFKPISYLEIQLLSGVSGGYITKVTAVFQGVNNFNLDLSVQDTTGGYNMLGSVVGMPSAQISIRAKFIGDLL